MSTWMHFMRPSSSSIIPNTKAGRSLSAQTRKPGRDGALLQRVPMKHGSLVFVPLCRAWKLCPQGVYVRPRMNRYVEVSQQVMEVFRRYTDLVEPLSIDEAFLDITGSVALLGAPDAIARSIKAETLQAT